MDTLNKFILETFGGQTPQELNGISSVLKDARGALESLSDQIDLLKGDIVRLRKENEVLRSGRDWQRDKAKLNEEALAIACQELATIVEDKITKGSCPICHFTDQPRDCEEDCPVCLANYLLGRAKDDREAVENNKEVRNGKGS